MKNPAGAAGEDGTDWLVLPGVRWDDLAQAGRAAAGARASDSVAADQAAAGARASDSATAGHADVADADAIDADVIDAGDGEEHEAGPGGFGWMAAVCAAAAECAVYGGLAAGGMPGAPVRAWPLAVLTVAAASAADLLGACREAAVAAGRCQDPGRSPRARRWARRLLRPPVGARAVLAAAGFVAGGPEAALLAVLGTEAAVITCTLAMLARIAPAAPVPALAVTGPGQAAPGGGPLLTTVVGVTGPQGVSAAVQVPTSGRSFRRSGATAAGGPGGEQGGLAAVLALRDDGAAARWAGRLVQGTLIPLPPAVAGLIATAMLAALGLRHLPGFIALTPPVVMMLAAPGSSHPHDGRFDWLVPVLLAAAQYIYLGSLGFGLAVPGPVVYGACAMTALWYAGLMARDRPAGRARGPGEDGEPAAPPPAIGWESRLLLIGFSATFGLAGFGYLGLAAYLGVLICRKIMAGYLIAWEEDRR